MAAVFIIPVFIVAIVGLTGYLVYRFLIRGLYRKRSVVQTLRKYNIKKTPSQIIREYYDSRGEQISQKEVARLEKNYCQNEPEQFLTMYDATRDSRAGKD